jgi:hypothetical protein
MDQGSHKVDFGMVNMHHVITSAGIAHHFPAKSLRILRRNHQNTCAEWTCPTSSRRQYTSASSAAVISSLRSLRSINRERHIADAWGTQKKNFEMKEEKLVLKE